MSNSSLVSYTRISPNSNNPRNNKILKITPHHMAGNLGLEQFGNIVANPGRQMSSNYAIDSQGNIGLFCEEKNRSWCSSSPANDHQAITIEVANDGGAPDWHVSDKALTALIDLNVDICKRNGIARMNFTGNANGNLTMHQYFNATACPGPYLKSKFPYIAEQVNKRLAASPEAAPPTPSEQPSSGGLHYVQVGAFRVKANAQSYAELVKSKGFQAVIKESGGLYRVQLGAFSSEQNAETFAQQVRSAGFDAIVTQQGGTATGGTNAPTSSSVQKGDRVKVNRGAPDYNGGGLASHVYTKVYYVQQLKGDRAVIGPAHTGTVTAAVNTKNLTKA